MGKGGQKYRYFLWLVLIVFLIILANWALAPSGRITYQAKFSVSDFFLGQIAPADRLDQSVEGKVKVIGEPVYLTLQTLRPFNQAKLAITYREEGAPLIEAGIMADKKIWRYETKPVQNDYIDQLSQEWFALRQDNLLLLQKEKKYDEIGSFLKNLNNCQRTAVFNYNLQTDFNLPDYQADKTEYELPFGLRGNYALYFYAKDETVRFEINFRDLNRNRDDDPVSINLYYQAALLDGRLAPDGRGQEETGQALDRDKEILEYFDLPEGLYKLEVKANDDIVSESIKTTQKLISFPGKIWLADKGKTNLKFYTDSTEVFAQTTNPGRLQSITIGNQLLNLTETYRQFSLDVPESPVGVFLLQDDVIIAGNGVFSLTKDDLLNPACPKVGRHFNPDQIDYILADYSSPVSNNDDNTKIAEIEFDLAKAYAEPIKNIFGGKSPGRAYSFIFSVPNLSQASREGAYLEIEKIEVSLIGNNWREILKSIIK